MTSIAFIMGVVPLVLATGPGAEVRRAMGIAVFAGMLGVTIFGLVLTPVFYVVIQGLAARLSSRGAAAVVPHGHRSQRRDIDRLRARLRERLAIAARRVGVRSARAHVAPPPASIRRRPAAPSRWDASAFSAEPYDVRWWRQFDDPVLEQLETARWRPTTTSGRPGAARSGARRLRRGPPRSLPEGDRGRLRRRRDQVVPGFTDEPVRINTYRAGLDAVWELDFFGRVRAAIAASSANAESFEAALQAVRVSVAAEVARNYFELRGIQQQLSVLDRSLVNQRETLRLTTVRRDAGIGEEQDVASASARVSAIESGLPPLRTALAAREASAGRADWPAAGAAAVDLAPRAYPILAKIIALGPARSAAQTVVPTCGRRNGGWRP